MGEHSGRGHDLLQTIPFYEHVVSGGFLLVILVDDSTPGRYHTLHHSMRQCLFQDLEREVQHLAAAARLRLEGRPHAELIFPDHLHIGRRQDQAIHVFLVQQSLLDVLHLQLQLQFPDGFQVELHGHEATPRWLVDLLEVQRDVGQGGSLDPALDDAGRDLAMLIHQFAGDDRCRDVLRTVDDLLDARHAQGHVHARHAGEVEGLQGHLCCRFRNGLRGHGSNGLPGHELGLDVLHRTPVDECLQLPLRRA
mmetsp:Transcript_116654/g.371095  ORF Transcript_116654/g.371095 Transcript_116654/m.371095 type:complete len:251 (-) Transcript_116654:432-1184(-)